MKKLPKELINIIRNRKDLVNKGFLEKNQERELVVWIILKGFSKHPEISNGNYKNNPVSRIILIRILTIFISLLFRKKITDATCGFRAFKTTLFIDILNKIDNEKYYTYRYEYLTLGKALLDKNLNGQNKIDFSFIIDENEIKIDSKKKFTVNLDFLTNY